MNYELRTMNYLTNEQITHFTTIRYTLYAIRSTLHAIRNTQYAIRNTNPTCSELACTEHSRSVEHISDDYLFSRFGSLCWSHSGNWLRVIFSHNPFVCLRALASNCEYL